MDEPVSESRGFILLRRIFAPSKALGIFDFASSGQGKHVPVEVPQERGWYALRAKTGTMYFARLAMTVELIFPKLRQIFLVTCQVFVQDFPGSMDVRDHRIEQKALQSFFPVPFDGCIHA